MSSRTVQTDAQRGFDRLQASFATFQKKLVDVMQSPLAYRIRLEVIGDRGRISEIQINELDIDRLNYDS